MQTSALRRQNPVTWKRAQRTVAVFALAAVVVCGATWAKVSRYDGRALPSPHFSTSVKIARIFLQNGLGDEPQALVDAGASLPEPDWNGFAPVPDPVAIAGAPPLPFQALRAPPVRL